jgi:hypothetical protein
MSAERKGVGRPWKLSVRGITKDTVLGCDELDLEISGRLVIATVVLLR